MNKYYDDEKDILEDDFWHDISEESDFPWNVDSEKMEKKTIHVVYVEPGELAVEADIGTELSDLQRAVGGGITLASIADCWRRQLFGVTPNPYEQKGNVNVR